MKRISMRGFTAVTTMYAWKYTFPAFLVPFMFVLDPKGVGILLKGSPIDIIWTTITAFMGIAALACGIQSWFLKPTRVYERIMLIAAGLFLVYPVAFYDGIGFSLIALVFVSQKFRATG